MSIPNPFKPAPFAPTGTASAQELHFAVGSTLNIWEHAESSFAQLFGNIIRPAHNSYAARRAYGSIANARGRKEMLEAVAEVFFANFQNDDAKETMRVLMNHYQDASARRNELAHGIVGGDRGEDGQFLGYFIVPSTWNTNKRDIHSAFKYRYSVKEINEKNVAFSTLGSRAISLAGDISGVFLSFPEKLRVRW